MAAPRYTSAHWLIIGLTAGYLFAAGVAAAVARNGEFVFYLLVMLLLFGTVAAIDRRVGFSITLLAGLCAWGAMHMAGGLVPAPADWPIDGGQGVLYSWWVVPFTYYPDGSVNYGLKYDHLTHAYGFGLTCWACWEGLCATIRMAPAHQQGEHPHPNPQPTLGPLSLCFAAALGLGALNEVVEFIATTLGPTNVGGYTNTGYDLIANTIGAAIAAAWIRLAYKP